MFKRILTYDTTARSQIRTITPELNALIAQSGVDNGTLLAYSMHTTLGLMVQETSEPNLCEDFLDVLMAWVESDGHRYKHTCALHPSGACVEDRFNAPSHVRQLLTNQSVVLDIQGGRLHLGRWQDVAFCEFDGPREGRQILVKILPDEERQKGANRCAISR
ncbi:MAG TPA: secondary thiamine-phosphate synthase enzyme YjbQ [Chthonomonadaceae bacterium]|nr:secondary thiamine-phosphate synthase enzyme YjbQ [Chthonomonadaceae bacterium]